MNRPRVFISAVTGELRGARRRVAEILIRKGYEPVTQDIWGTEPGDLRPMLRRQIEDCHGLIQIVGDAYGAEPPAPDADFGRCSYTQYEFLLARKLGKKTWLLIAGPDCVRDTPPAQLDLPADPARPDPVGWQSEHQELQRRYRQRPEFANHLYHEAENDLALDLAVERLGDELAALREEFRKWQHTVLRLAAALILLTGIVLGAVWWVKKRQDTVVAGQKEIVRGQKEFVAGPKITTAGIRKQILLGSERKRDRDLAEADKAESLKREKLREAALAAHESRIARIDELALSFAEIEGRADATAVFREMTRILEQEGVDFALAYIAEQKGGIIERIRQRKETGRLQTRTELQPLFSAAKLQESAGQSVAARASYRQLLDFDPTWSEALDAFAWFLCDQSNLAETHGSLSNAVADAEEAHKLATGLQDALSANPTARRLLAVAQSQMGDVLIMRGQQGDAEKALDYFIRCVKTFEAMLTANPRSAEVGRDVSVSLNKLGDFLTKRGQPGDAESALRFLARSLEINESLLNSNPGSALSVRDMAVSLNRIGDFLATSGQPGDAEKALGNFTRSSELLESLLKTNPGSTEAARDVSVSLNKLGDFLSIRGQAGDGEKALGYFTRSLEIAETLLKANPASVRAARDVSVSLNKLGDFFTKRGRAGDAQKTLGYLSRNLEIAEKLLTANPHSAEAARDVSVSLIKLGDFLTRSGQRGDAEKALVCFTRSNKTLEALLKADPGSAEAARDVSVSLERLGDFLAKRGQAGDAKNALAYYTRSHDLANKMFMANPGSAQAARHVWVSLNKLGDFLAARGQQGDAEQALGHYTRSLELANQLLKANAGSAQAARDVSVSLTKLGELFITRDQEGDVEKALDYFMRCNETLEVLLKADPSSAEKVRDVSISLTRLADVFAKRGKAGDTDRAIHYYTRDLEISEPLLKASSGSKQAALHVATSLSRLAGLLAKRGQVGDAEKALGYHARDFEISEALLKADPGSTEAARDVVVSCVRLGLHTERMGKGDAMQWWRRAYAILSGMKERGEFMPPEELKYLEALREKVGK